MARGGAPSQRQPLSRPAIVNSTPIRERRASHRWPAALPGPAHREDQSPLPAPAAPVSRAACGDPAYRARRTEPGRAIGPDRAASPRRTSMARPRHRARARRPQREARFARPASRAQNSTQCRPCTAAIPRGHRRPSRQALQTEEHPRGENGKPPNPGAIAARCGGPVRVALLFQQETTHRPRHACPARAAGGWAKRRQVDGTSFSLCTVKRTSLSIVEKTIKWRSLVSMATMPEFGHTA